VIQGPSVPGLKGTICCDPHTNCEVQTQYQKGTSYFDGVNNRTRFDGNGQIIVSLYNIGKEMLVDANLVCKEFCPVETEFDDSPFWPSDPSDQATIKDLGNVTVDGVVCRHYQWIEKIAHIIKMQQTDMYVHVDNKTGIAFPIKEHDIIEPFGQKLGTADSAWTDVDTKQPDAGLFAVTGIESCPESPNCQESSWQQRRLRNRDFAGFLKYHQNL